MILLQYRFRHYVPVGIPERRELELTNFVMGRAVGVGVGQRSE